MTPEDVVDIETGDKSPEELAESMGFGSVGEMAETARKHKNREGYDRRKDDQIEKLNTRILELETKKEEEELALDGDESESAKRMAREIINLKRTVNSLASKTLTEEGDEELQPYFAQAKRENPELMTIKDPARRLQTMRRIARDLKAENDKSAPPETAGVDASTAHLSGGSTPVTRRGSVTEDQALERYEKELGAAKTKTELDAISAKYRKKYPGWGI